MCSSDLIVWRFREERPGDAIGPVGIPRFHRDTVRSAFGRHPSPADSHAVGRVGAIAPVPADQHSAATTDVLMRAALLLLALFTVAAGSGGSGRILKVLPHLLDGKGHHTLSPSLLERDAYQAELRLHPEIGRAHV